MVVRVAIGRQWKRRGFRLLLRSGIVLAALGLFHSSSRPASLLLNSAPGLVSPFGSSPSVLPSISSSGHRLLHRGVGAAETPSFDPAATALFSSLSYGAMSVMAPNIYGDFLSPSVLSFDSSLKGGGLMPDTMGLEPATSSMLDGIFQQGVLPGTDPVEAEEFNVGPSGVLLASSGSVAALGGAGVASSSVVDGFAGGVSTVSGAAALPNVSTAEGIRPACNDSQMANQLQRDGEFWNFQGTAATPIQFPRGVFAGGELGNPLGDLGPHGNRSNVPAGGPATWCRSSPGPFSQSSPLEDRLLWIAGVLTLTCVLVFWLSRGMKLPVRSARTEYLPHGLHGEVRYRGARHVI